MQARLSASIVAIALLAGAGPVSSGASSFVPGEKLDSGLGELPHYSKWTDPSGRSPLSTAVAGESLDSGLGELPHYSQWVDPTGRDPMGRPGTQVSRAAD